MAYEPAPDPKDPGKKVLEALVTNNADLEKLEALLGRFNLFEAIGVVKQELRHSYLLAFLLNPQKNHRLGDAFVKHLLKKALVIAQQSDMDIPITLIDLDTWSFNDIEVRREWKNIDVLISDKFHKLAVIIENKIGSHEHSDQLQRYYQYIQDYYSDYRLIGLYLTPDGDQPSEGCYIPLDYGLVCTLLEDLMLNKESVLDSDVVVMVRHYTQMLRRHIVSNSEIAELCRRIYRTHQQALDLIYEHRPDHQATIREICEGLIKQQPELIPEESKKSYIRFLPKEWDFSALQAGSGWVSSGRMLLFEFANSPESLKLNLVIGPGPLEIRQKLFRAFSSRAPSGDTFKNPYLHIRVCLILDKKSYENSDDEIAEKVRAQWQIFLDQELPKLDAKMKALEWLIDTSDKQP
ncbi:MAG TPA: PD-(D/E)XK nuclease family protein [Ktedonobacteraceae bacterium]|nr:PD-(D/E)XK nuclease family protein [Ktedonobacteraceae bacterium]